MEITLSPFGERLQEKCQKNLQSLAFVEGEDTRIIQAACYLLTSRSVAHIHLWGDKEKILSLASHLPLKNYLQQVTFHVPNDKSLISLAQKNLQEQSARRNKVTTREDITPLAHEPIYQSLALLTQGTVDSMLAGAVLPTAMVIKASLRSLIMEKEVKTLSSCFILVKENAPNLLFADCSVVVEPDHSQLVQIATESVNTWNRLFQENPVVAFLSFSTRGSAKHAMVSKVVRALNDFQQLKPEVLADGEIQFDAAFDQGVGHKKAPDSAIPGRSNIFIFPNLDAGNISYKIMQRVGGYAAYGPILQGFTKPVSDLSRGANVSDIIVSAFIQLIKSMPCN